MSRYFKDRIFLNSYYRVIERESNIGGGYRIISTGEWKKTHITHVTAETEIGQSFKSNKRIFFYDTTVLPIANNRNVELSTIVEVKFSNGEQLMYVVKNFTQYVSSDLFRYYAVIYNEELSIDKEEDYVIQPTQN